MTNKNLETASIFLGILLFSFLNAWDFQSHEGSMSLTFLWVEDFWKIRPTIYFLQYILKIGYWGFFTIHILFIITFIIVGKKLSIENIHIFLPLILLPIMRYGVWDYGTHASDSLAYLIMTLIFYYGKKNDRIKYTIFSIIGVLTREFCLYINMYFIISDFFDRESISSLYKNRSNLISKIIFVLRHRIFEIIIIIAYVIFRTIFFATVLNESQLDSGSLVIVDFSKDLLNPKMLFRIVMIYSYLTYYILKKNELKLYIIFIVVGIFSFLFGNIWEIDKIGCIFMIYVFEIFKKE